MLNLVYKDFMLQRGTKSFLFMLVMPIISSFAFSTDILYGILPFITGSYLYVVYANALDDKYKSEKMLIAMPIRRQTIVGSKYLGVLLYMISFLAVIALVTSLIHLIVPGTAFVQGLRWSHIVQFLTIFSIYYGIFFPLYFKVGYQKSRWANYIALLAAGGLFLLSTKGLSTIAGINIPSLQIALEYMTGLGENLWNAVLPSLAVTIITVSIFLSKVFYQRREF